MEKQRVLHLITQLELGGAQRNTLYTVGHLSRDRFIPMLACGPGGKLDAETTASDWKTFFIPHLVRPVHPLYDLRALLELYRVLRDVKPHILHTHSSKAGILGRMAGYLAGVPVIIHTFHGFGFTPDQPRWLYRLFIALERFCARLSSHLIFVSRDNEQEAEALHVGETIPHSLIRSGIRLGIARPKTSFPSELRIPQEAKVVISVGNFKPQKNPLDLIRVASQVIRSDGSVHFVLVGDGELRDAARALTESEGIVDHVHFLGWRDDIADLLAAADVFLLTSLWEGLPRALVEAFAAQRPAVAYAVNGVRDILIDGENGFAISPGEVSVAAEKVLWLLSHPSEARAMAERGTQRVKEEFDIDRMVSQQESLYSALYDRVPLKDYYAPRWTPLQPL